VQTQIGDDVLIGGHSTILADLAATASSRGQRRPGAGARYMIVAGNPARVIATARAVPG